MKIDVSSPAVSQLLAGRSQPQPAKGGSIDSQSTTADRTTLSSESTSVQALTQQALKVPEVRQDRVDALRQSISNGMYETDPGKIADAIINSNGE